MRKFIFAGTLILLIGGFCISATISVSTQNKILVSKSMPSLQAQAEPFLKQGWKVKIIESQSVSTSIQAVNYPNSYRDIMGDIMMVLEK